MRLFASILALAPPKRVLNRSAAAKHSVATSSCSDRFRVITGVKRMGFLSGSRSICRGPGWDRNGGRHVLLTSYENRDGMTPNLVKIRVQSEKTPLGG